MWFFFDSRTLSFSIFIALNWFEFLALCRFSCELSKCQNKNAPWDSLGRRIRIVSGNIGLVSVCWWRIERPNDIHVPYIHTTSLSVHMLIFWFFNLFRSVLDSIRILKSSTLKLLELWELARFLDSFLFVLAFNHYLELEIPVNSNGSSSIFEKMLCVRLPFRRTANW